MITADWGPHAWKFLHHVTFNYPENPTPQEQQDAENLFLSLKSLLPCEDCKVNFTNELNSFPIDTRSKYSLSNWLVNVHNAVNQRLNKKTITYAEASKMYGNECSQCKNARSLNKSTNNNTIKVLFYIVLIFIIIAILLLLLHRRYPHLLKHLRR